MPAEVWPGTAAATTPRTLNRPRPPRRSDVRYHRPPTIASPSRVSDAAGHSVCKLHTRNAARRREGWLRPPPPPPPTAAASPPLPPPPPPPRTLYIHGFHPPPAAVSDVHYDPRAAASARARRAAGRCLIAGTRPAALRVLVCECACVFVRARGLTEHGCGGSVGGEAGRRRGKGWKGPRN